MAAGRFFTERAKAASELGELSDAFVLLEAGEGRGGWQSRWGVSRGVPNNGGAGPGKGPSIHPAPMQHMPTDTADPAGLLSLGRRVSRRGPRPSRTRASLPQTHRGAVLERDTLVWASGQANRVTSQAGQLVS